MKPCNVLFLFSDEHNPFFSGPYGHPFVQTPALDELASRGVVFDAAYCPAPLCAPSRAALFTGLRSHQVPSYHNADLFDGSQDTWAGALHAQGVYTVHGGKTDSWPDAPLGFSEILERWDRGKPGDTNFCRHPLAIRADAHTRLDRAGAREPFRPRDLELTRRAADWLRGTAPGLGRSWVLAVHWISPHFPHYVSQELWDLYADHADDMPTHDGRAAWEQHPDRDDLIDHFELQRVTPEQIKRQRRGYFGLCTLVDRMIGELVTALRETGLFENTLVIYSSDHGEMLGEHGLWWKGSMDEHSVRVPLVMAGPGLPEGQHVATPVDLLDVQATFFDATGRSRPEAWVGESLLKLANDPSSSDARAVFSEYHGHGVRRGNFMIRKGSWKLIYSMGAAHRLYNIARDPDERENLADARPDKFAELEAELRSICTPENVDREAHERQRRQLDELGLAHGYRD